MIQNYARKSIKDLVPYEFKEYTSAIKLDANENNHVDFVLNQRLVQALMNIKINKYPDSECNEVRGILARDLLVSKDQVVVGCGSDQIIAMIINAFVEKNEKILTLSPTFMMYKLNNDIAGGKTVEVPLEEGFTFDYYSFMMAVKKEKPKVIFLANPNNPTGGIIHREHIIKIVEFSNSIVVVDEAYYEFCKQSVADLVPYYPNLIVMRTLSKAYGMAGVRVGYAVSTKELINILKKTKPPYNISSLDQVAARICLENKNLFSEVIEEIIKERENLFHQLQRFPQIKVYESFGNFILIELEEAKELYQYLLENQVVLRYFGEEGSLKNCLRISIGTGEENKKVLSLLEKFYHGGPRHEKQAV